MTGIIQSFAVNKKLLPTRVLKVLKKQNNNWYSLKENFIVGYKVSILGHMRYAGYAVYSKLFSVKYSNYISRKIPSKQLISKILTKMKPLTKGSIESRISIIFKKVYKNIYSVHEMNHLQYEQRSCDTIDNLVAHFSVMKR